MNNPSDIPASLLNHIEENVLPRYESFDKAHSTDHIRQVMEDSLLLAPRFNLDARMVYTAAAYHDLGMVAGRELHHLESGRIIREETELLRWFSPEEIEIMAQAAEDHRASNKSLPRSRYGEVLAEADRRIDPEKTVRRTIEYGLAHYSNLDRNGHYERAYEHLKEKYGYGGYLRLPMQGTRNSENLQKLRELTADRNALEKLFISLYNELTDT